MAHFSFASLIQIGFLFILICWTKESSGASFSLEEEFKQFKIQMKEIVKNLESKVTELEAKDVQMQTKVNELELRDVEMRDKTTNLENKVTELEDKIAQQDSLLFDLLQEKNERTAAAANFEFAPMLRSNGSAVSINGLPSSCGDLKMIGHIWSGIYSIAGSAMMESVYCDFSKLPSDPDFQKWIGYVDVKSAPVHFYVQRSSPFYTNSTPIPFELTRVNEGNAMNLTSGIFTAPRPGIYFFSFTGMVNFPASSSRVWLGVDLFLNGDEIGVGHVQELNTIAGQSSPLTLQSTLKLKKGDQVWVRFGGRSTGTYLYDDKYHYNHFTGFMLEEDIVASLS